VKVPNNKEVAIHIVRRSWSLGRTRMGGGIQSGDTLCFVSPDRYAVSSLTYAKRITRLIV